ncbi:50S ribosomal protein L32 [Chloroflexota bacterium]
MALPKRKTPKAKRDQRRSHRALTPPNLDSCPQCHSPKLPHHTCPTCGTYAGRQVIEVEAAKKKAD